MKTILQKEDLIKKGKDELGMLIDFEDIFEIKEITSDNFNNKNAVLIKEFSNGFFKEPKLEDKANHILFSEILYDILSHNIKDFFKESSGLLVGEVIAKQIGVLNIYTHPSKIVYDFMTDDNNQIISDLKRNKQKTINYAYNIFNKAIEKQVVDFNIKNIKNRLLLTFNFKLEKYSYSDYLIKCMRKTKTNNDFNAFIGLNTKKESILLDLDKNPNISLRASQLNRDFYINKFLLSLKVLNDSEPLQTIILDKDYKFSHLANKILIEDEHDLKKSLKNIEDLIQERLKLFSDSGYETIKEYNNAFQDKKQDRIVIVVNTDIKDKNAIEILSDISMFSKNVGIFILFTFSEYSNKYIHIIKNSITKIELSKRVDNRFINYNFEERLFNDLYEWNNNIYQMIDSPNININLTKTILGKIGK